MRGILLWGGAGTAALLVLLLFLLTRPGFVGWVLAAAIDGAGYGPSRLKVVEVGLSRLAVEDVAVGKGPLLAAGRIVVDYRLPALLGGRLEAAEIDALRLKAGLDAQGFHMALPPAPKKSGGGKPFDFRRLPPIALKDARLQLDTGQGTYEFVVDGALAPTGPQRLEASPMLAIRRAEEPERSISGAAGIVVDGRRAELTLALNRPGDRALFEGGTIDGLDLALVSDPKTGLEGTAKLALSGLSLGPLDRGSARLELALKSPDGGFLPTRETLTASLKAEASDVAIAPAFWDTRLAALPASTRAAFDLDGLRPFRDSLLDALKTLDGGTKISLGADLTGAPEGKGRKWTIRGSSVLADDAGLVLLLAAEDKDSLVARLPVLAQSVRGTAMRSVVPSSASAGIEATEGPEGSRLRLGASASLQGAGLPWTTADLDGTIEARADAKSGGLALAAFDLGRIRVKSDIWKADGLSIEAKTLSLSAHGTPENFSGEASFDLAGDGSFFPWLGLGDAALALKGRFARQVGRTTLDLGTAEDSCGHLTAKSIRFAEMRFAPGPDGIALCGREGMPFTDFVTDASGAAKLTVTARVPPASARLEGPADLAGLPAIAGTLPSGDFAFRYDPQTEGWTLDIATAGGRVKALPDLAELGPLDLGGRLEGEGALVTRGELALNAVTVRDGAKAPRFLPVTARGRALVDDAKARFTGALAGEGRTLADVTASHDLRTGRGSAELALNDLLFTPQGLQPQAMVPALKGVVTEVAGKVDAQAQLAWGPKSFSSKGEVSAEGLEFVSRLAPVVGLDGRIAFRSLVPPLTEGVETVRIKRIETPILLEDGEIAFALKEGAAVELAKASWPLAGGTIGLENAELSFAKGAPPQEVVFAASAVDLGQFLPLLRLPGVSGTGLLDGRVPLVIANGKGTIVGGRLEGRAPGGTLSYHSDAADAASASGGAQTSLLFQALDNFQWDELALTLDGEVDGRLDVQLELRGANPAVYNGYPFKIRVKTSGAFAELLRQGTVGFRVKDLIDAGRAAE
ncbi:MAG: YdbH domain-containing protein [Alphaproteobacteria bacterium]|nr:YdbH domain-containing protein [Alphaproteobacteria bacterium]